MRTIHVGIFHYSGSPKSAVYGLEEAFQFANRACLQLGEPCQFLTSVFQNIEDLTASCDVLLLPPANDDIYYLAPLDSDIQWMVEQHRQGTLLASACAGAFVLAATGLVQHRSITTHWGLAQALKAAYPKLEIDSNQILIDHHDIITAGGMMSWLDLALELIARFASPAAMRLVGKLLVVDTAPREQRFYQQFLPNLQHGDQAIVDVQQYINLYFADTLVVEQLAIGVHMTVRTLQRRLKAATGFNPNQYIQRVRVQKVCDLLETGNESFEVIARQVGYEDSSACRKVFVKVMGLTPVEFRRRFQSKSKIAKV
ncbi:GlxA family transcriptional regulator [Vibrio agarivorans]|uniref:GlxA family transcriptional regulator n=1 Tax=Vibrio agarivorans TaxID=153622 RepID=UPI00222EC218|nr:helix-turn-helix domain-containing protein [Vibrio agarivorans]